MLGKAWMGWAWLRVALVVPEQDLLGVPKALGTCGHWSASFSLVMSDNTRNLSQRLYHVILSNYPPVNSSSFERSIAFAPKCNPNNKTVWMSWAKGKLEDDSLEAACAIRLCLGFFEILIEALSVQAELAGIQ